MMCVFARRILVKLTEEKHQSEKFHLQVESVYMRRLEKQYSEDRVEMIKCMSKLIAQVQTRLRGQSRQPADSRFSHILFEDFMYWILFERMIIDNKEIPTPNELHKKM